MTFEEAKYIAENKAKEVKKIIMSIKENEDYWYFEAGIPNEVLIDNGAGSLYVSKKDGTIIPMRPWLNEVQELNRKFYENSQIIYDYYQEKNTNTSV